MRRGLLTALIAVLALPVLAGCYQARIENTDLWFLDVAPDVPVASETVDAPAELPKDVPAEVAADAPAETAADAPAETAADAPAETAGDAPVETAGDAPAEVAADTPAEATADAPVEVAADAPAEAVDTVTELPVDVPAEVATELPLPDKDRETGLPCTKDDQCWTMICLTTEFLQLTNPNLTVPGGMCSYIGCYDDSECGPGAKCADANEVSPGFPMLCVKQCTADAECGRDGYVCPDLGVKDQDGAKLQGCLPLTLVQLLLCDNKQCDTTPKDPYCPETCSK